MLRLQRVHVQVLAFGVLAQDHALVDRLTGGDEQEAALLQIIKRIGHRLALLQADQHASPPGLDRSLVRRVVAEHPVHDAGAAGIGQELAVIADQAAGRRMEHQPCLARAGGAHLLHLAAALADLFDDRAGIFLVHVNDDFLDRLLALALVVGLKQHPRAADR